jgi:hypothetical protein
MVLGSEEAGHGLLVENLAVGAGQYGIHIEGIGGFDEQYPGSWAWRNVWMVSGERGCRNAPDNGTYCVSTLGQIPADAGANLSAVAQATANVRDPQPF